MQKPTPRNEEIKLDRYKYIMSRTDASGIIEYGNDYFFEISGYSSSELVGKPHSIIRHPDMPKVIFKLMWEYLKSGKSLFAIVKNLAKDGRYYWVTTRFDIKHNPVDHRIEGYVAYRQAAKPESVKRIIPLYQELLKIEQNEGVGASERYLMNLLESKGVSYDEFIDDIAENSGAVKQFFQTMANFFSSK